MFYLHLYRFIIRDSDKITVLCLRTLYHRFNHISFFFFFLPPCFCIFLDIFHISLTIHNSHQVSSQILIPRKLCVSFEIHLSYRILFDQLFTQNYKRRNLLVSFSR